MEYHISAAITIQALAADMGITERRLNQYFMEYSRQTDMSITEIAGEVGWQNASKFSGAFKLKYEMSPLEYRKVNKFV